MVVNLPVEEIDLDRIKCYSIEQVADHLGVGVLMVRQLLDSGELPHLRVGHGRGRVLIRACDLADYLETKLHKV